MKRKPTYLHPLPTRPSETSLTENDSSAVQGSAQALPNFQNSITEPTDQDWRTELRLCLTIIKPITWVPVVWSFWCGAVMAGGLNWTLDGLTKLLVGLFLSGPLLCGMAQAINDWFDREVDAVNEPWRPIASGQLSVIRIYQVIGALGFLGLMAAYYLGPVVMLLAFFGIFMAHNYSAPPLRLKRFTWLGPLSSATSYIIVPWLAAASVFGGITWRAVATTVCTWLSRSIASIART